MRTVNHELTRRVAGFKILLIIYLVICLLNLILAIVIPPSNFQIINQGTMLLNLIWVLVFALFLQKLNDANYKYFSIIVLFMLPTYYFILDYLFELDNSFFNPTNLGLGRSVDSLFLLPIVFVVSSILFLRQSIILIAITLFSILAAYNLYEVLADDKTYLTDNWQTILEDANAINITLLTNWINIWIIISIVCYAIVFLVDKLMNDAVKFEKSTAQFSRYFSPNIREKIQEEDLEIKENENNSQAVAVLFTDIDGFTELSETLSSKEIIELLSDYQDRMIRPIFKNSGTVDKFIGDSVMATFGTPVSQGNDAQNAFNCAREMQIAMRQWTKERKDNNQPTITHRIGISYGTCVVGNIGNEDRKEFTVIGDVVNVANRVCDVCKDLKCSLLITDTLKNRLNEAINAEEIKDYPIRGRKDKINLYKVET